MEQRAISPRDVRTRTEMREVREGTPARLPSMGDDEAGQVEYGRLTRMRSCSPHDAVQTRNWELENQRLRDEVAHMHQATTEW